MANENLGVYEPGADLTGRATAAVVGKRFVKITGDRSGGNIAVAHCAAGERAFGVSKYDQPTVGDIVGVMRGNSRVTFVLAGAAIAAGQEVQSGANGVAIPKAAGIAVGYAVTGAADATDAEISLY